MLKTKMIVILGALLAVGQAAFGANILINPGFEDGVLAPWVNDNDFCGGCAWDVTNADAHSGTWSAEVDGNRLLLQSFAAIDASLISQISFWARHPGGGAAMAIVLRYDDATETEDQVGTLSSGWEFFNVTAFLNPSKNLVAFGVYGNSGALARLDDVVVDARQVNGEVPEPATFALMGAGLAAVALRRRMRG